jgi:peptidoglycan-associated lipoprotein
VGVQRKVNILEFQKEDFMRNFVFVVLLIFGLVFAGCASKKVVQPEQPLTPEVQKEPTAAPKQPSEMPQAGPSENITEKQLAKIETKEEMPKYREEESVFEDIHFDFDKYDIQESAKPVLQKIASWLLKNPSPKILIEGHCDERGTSEYNLALGDRRARAARDYLVALAVPSGRIEMISYGKEKPLCTEKTEECWAKNRRAHFVILREAEK